MKCPCDDCLKYPICISKAIIRCNDLIEYAQFNNEREYFWKRINRMYPKCNNVYDEKYKEGYIK